MTGQQEVLTCLSSSFSFPYPSRGFAFLPTGRRFLSFLVPSTRRQPLAPSLWVWPALSWTKLFSVCQWHPLKGLPQPRSKFLESWVVSPPLSLPHECKDWSLFVYHPQLLSCVIYAQGHGSLLASSLHGEGQRSQRSHWETRQCIKGCSRLTGITFRSQSGRKKNRIFIVGARLGGGTAEWESENDICVNCLFWWLSASCRQHGWAKLSWKHDFVTDDKLA